MQIGVASTKAYTSQVLVMTMMALMMAEDSAAKASKRTKVIKALQVRQPGSLGLGVLHCMDNLVSG